MITIFQLFRRLFTFFSNLKKGEEWTVDNLYNTFNNKEILYMEEDSEDILILKPVKGFGVTMVKVESPHAAVIVSDDVLKSKIDKLNIKQARIVGEL